MKTILLPTDFSDVSDNAINYAVEFAKLTGAKLILFHVYHVPVITTDMPVVIPSMDELGNDSMDALKKVQQRIYPLHSGSVPIECRCECGLEVDEINEFVKANNVDLIITGMKGAGGFEEKMLGSVTTSLMRKVNCPVLAIDKSCTFKTISKIALACDFKELKNKVAFEPLKKIISLFNAHLYIVNVLKEQKDLIPTTEQAIAGMHLEHMLEGVNHSFHYEENAHVVDGINNFVNKHGIDLIVMVPRSHSLLQNIFHEPNTKRMAFHTHVPLLSLHE
jgi:nucleotide-binding universal stress UspA family protein